MDTNERLQRQLSIAMTAHFNGNGTAIIPEAGRLAWRWFLDLTDTRTWHPAGPNPISYAEIVAWSHAMRWPLQPRHVALIRALDEVWLTNFYAQRKREQDGKETKKLPQLSKEELTPELFDAMFGD